MRNRERRATTTLLLCSLALLLASCATPPSANKGEKASKVDPRDTLDAYVASLRATDQAAVLGLYTDDAIVTMLDADGSRQVFKGKDEIGHFYVAMARAMPAHLQEFGFADLREGVGRAGEPPELGGMSSTRPIYHDFAFAPGKPRPLISRHLGSTRLFHMRHPPATPFLAWADRDGNGSLAPAEQTELIEAFKRFESNEDRPVSNPLEAFFDFSGDGALGDTEREIARVTLVCDNLRRLAYRSEGFKEVFFPNTIHYPVANFLTSILFNSDPGWEMGKARVATEDYRDRELDLDGDGYIHGFEIEAFRESLFRLVALFPDEPLYNREIAGTREEILHWADMDGDGLLGPVELTDLGRVVDAIQTPFETWEWMPAETPLHRFFDLDGDLLVGKRERTLARAFLYDVLLSLVSRRGIKGWVGGEDSAAPARTDVNADGRYDREDRDALVSLMTDWGGFRAHEAKTPADRLVDEDGNLFVTDHEAERFYQRNFTAAVIAWMELPDELIEAFRKDPEGFLEREASFDGSASEGAVAAAAKSTAGKGADTGVVRVGVRARRLAGELAGKTVAVTGILNRSTLVDEATAQLLLPFIEDGFVNVGSARVVERGSIEHIMKEYEFQASGLVDERTAVRVGKLAGANAIAMAVLQNISDTVYLQLKVISADSGEILGSAIAETESLKDLRSLCLAAVRMLF